MNEVRVRRAIAEACRAIHARGWVANHDGNVSARVAPGRIVCTPTAVSKGAIDEDLLIVVDGEGRLVAGRLKPFGEINLHLAVYAARADVQAVLHAHPPHATALGVAGHEIVPFLAEAVVSLGTRVPLVPFAMPGADAASAISPYLGEFDAVLLEAHGTLGWGESVEQALLRTELVEHLARIQLLGATVGPQRALGEAEVKRLLEARTKAGLGPAGRRRPE